MTKSDSRAMIADIAQQVAESVLTATTPFHGTTDAEARRYCRQIFVRKLANSFRADDAEQNRRYDFAESNTLPDGQSNGLPALDDGVSDQGDEVVAAIAVLRRLTEAARGSLVDVAALWLAFGKRAGVSVAEQIAVLTAALNTARQREARIYKVRNRGDWAMRRALAKLANRTARGPRREHACAGRSQYDASCAGDGSATIAALTVRIDTLLVEKGRERARAAGRSVTAELALALGKHLES